MLLAQPPPRALAGTVKRDRSRFWLVLHIPMLSFSLRAVSLMREVRETANIRADWAEAISQDVSPQERRKRISW